MSLMRLKSLTMCRPGQCLGKILALITAVGGLHWFVACQAPLEPVYVTPHPATQATARPMVIPTRASPTPLATPRYLHTATLLSSGQVLVVGGKDGSGPLSTAELYNPTTNSWSSAGTLATARAHHTATLLPSGKVLVVGGRNSDTSFVATAELYDPATNSWTPAGTLAASRADHTTLLLRNGSVLAAGGYNASQFLDTTELYDPVENTWGAAGTMLHLHSSGHTASLLPDGQALVVAGFGTSSQAEAEQYDPATSQWSAAGSLADGRVGHTATVLSGEKVLVAGGANSAQGGTYLATTELFDPVANNWRVGAAMVNRRSGHAAVLLPDGQVLIIGGRDESGPVAYAERYAPDGNRWAPAGALAEARWLHTATVLPSGQLLVVGGKDSSDRPLASTEQYDPSTNSWVSAR